MLVFEIKNGEEKRIQGYLFYFEKAEEFLVELDDSLDEWTAPLQFSGSVKKGIYSISKNISRLWVEGRVVPVDRQNIGMILKNAGLKEYSVGKLLRITKGRCCQDSDYLKEIKYENLPNWVLERQKDNIRDCFWGSNNQVILLCEDDTVRSLSVEKLKECESKIEAMKCHQKIMQSVKVDIGGHGIVFSNGLAIDKTPLLQRAEVLPIKACDFYTFAKANLVHTTEACEILQCTRQNLAYLTKTKKLTPIQSLQKENVYLKGDVERSNWG